MASPEPRPTDQPDQRYAVLPDRIRPEDMITEQPTRDPGDPTLGGIDSNRNWMLRNAG